MGGRGRKRGAEVPGPMSTALPMCSKIWWKIHICGHLWGPGGPVSTLHPDREQRCSVCRDEAAQQMVDPTLMSLCVLCTFYLLVMNLQIL